MFLVIYGHGWSNSAVQLTFKHSSETRSRKFGEVLDCIVASCEHYIKPIDPDFSTTYSRITCDLDDANILKIALEHSTVLTYQQVPPQDYIRYIGRSGKSTQNILAVVGFDLKFTYASIGQPGSMHDTGVLFHAIENDDKFPNPPQGKYYHVNVGYLNREGYLALYKGERYHIPDWRRGSSPSVEQELFNHLPLLCVFITTFARIVQKIRCDRNPDYILTIPSRFGKHVASQSPSDTSTPQTNHRSMDIKWDQIAKAIFLF